VDVAVRDVGLPQNPEAPAFISRIKTARPEPGWAVTVVDASFALGEGTAIINDVYRDPGSGEQFYNTYVVFQTGNLFVGTGFFRSVAEPVTPVASPTAGEMQTSPAATIEELEAFSTATSHLTTVASRTTSSPTPRPRPGRWPPTSSRSGSSTGTSRCPATRTC
jgi:hypothetical protein